MEQLVKCIEKNGVQYLNDMYNVKITYSKNHPELCCLCYDQLRSPKNVITDHCRGTIVNASTGEIIALPFVRFHDYDPKKKTDFDFNNFIAYEKLDGSLVSVWHYGGVWNVSTKSSPDASGKILDMEGYTYESYFWETMDKLKMARPSATSYTYIFEFKFPSTKQFVTECVEPSITFIGIRGTSGTEVPIDRLSSFVTDMNWETPVARKAMLNELIEQVEEMNPLECEGYVLTDCNFNRLKLKSRRYELLSLIKQPIDSVLTPERRLDNLKRLIQLSQLSWNKDFVKKYYWCEQDYAKVISAKKNFHYEYTKVYDDSKIMTAPDLYEKYKNHKMKAMVFHIARSTDFSTFIKGLSIKTYAETLKKYM